MAARRAIHLMGPVGRGFQLPSGRRRWLLAAFGASPEVLLPVLNMGVDRGVGLAMYANSPPPALPPQVEISPRSRLRIGLGDYACLAVTADGLERSDIVAAGLMAARGARRAEVLIVQPMPCGTGVCGACAVAEVAPPAMRAPMAPSLPSRICSMTAEASGRPPGPPAPPTGASPGATLTLSAGKRDLVLRTPFTNAAGFLGCDSTARQITNFEGLGAYVTPPLSLKPRSRPTGQGCSPTLVASFCTPVTQSRASRRGSTRAASLGSPSLPGHRPYARSRPRGCAGSGPMA